MKLLNLILAAMATTAVSSMPVGDIVLERSDKTAPNYTYGTYGHHNITILPFSAPPLPSSTSTSTITILPFSAPPFPPATGITFRAFSTYDYTGAGSRIYSVPSQSQKPVDIQISGSRFFLLGSGCNAGYYVTQYPDFWCRDFTNAEPMSITGMTILPNNTRYSTTYNKIPAECYPATTKFPWQCATVKCVD